MIRFVRLLAILCAGLVGEVLAGPTGGGNSGPAASSRAAALQQPASADQKGSLRENEYDTDLCITHMDISLKTDFQSNNVQAVVTTVMENTSGKSVDKADFWLCPSMNDPDFTASLKHVHLLDDHGSKELKHSVREVPDGSKNGGRKWLVRQVALPGPVRPGEKLKLQFEYTMTGKPDHSSAPIEKSSEGFKEVYLRGSDYLWCPTPYFDPKPGVSRKTRSPSWTLTIECPAGYVAVTDGELRRREEKGGLVRDEWTSLKPGTPVLYVSQFKVVKRTVNGITFEVYAPDEKLLNKAAENIGKYARMYELYGELFGDPGHRSYRIVGSAVTGVGASFGTGTLVNMHRLEDTHHVAHEMAHTWWGWLVRADGPGWKFLSEAMAEFSARWVLWGIGEKQESHESLSDDNILGWKQRRFCTYFAVPDPAPRSWTPLVFQDGYDPWNVSATNYHWGPLVVNQIRLILGDEVFFRSLKSFLEKYRGKQAGMDEFVQTINAVSGRDMTSELKGLLANPGCASYRLAGFVSEKAGDGYRTTVRIRNEGDYGLTCPLLLRTTVGEDRRMFKVEAGQEKEIPFTTGHRVFDVVIDPDMTTLQYHPEQKLRLWQATLRAMEGYGNNEYYGKAYLHYALGEPAEAVDTMSDYLGRAMRRVNVNGIDELLAKDDFHAGYVFMRGVFYLALDDREHAEADFKSAFPYMLRVMEHGQSVGVPEGYYDMGAIGKKDLGEYLTLLTLIAGRKLSFESGLDDAAKKRRVEEWKQWWEKEGKQKKLDLGALKERCEAQRQAFCRREISLAKRTGRTGR